MKKVKYLVVLFCIYLSITIGSCSDSESTTLNNQQSVDPIVVDNSVAPIDGSSSNPNEPATSIRIDYTDTSIYPIFEAVSFRSHTTNHIFKLSDDSPWKISGTSNPSLSTGITTSDVVINIATSDTPDPGAGARSDYYLVGNSFNPAFFIDPILMPVAMTDTVSFRSHSTSHIFMLSDSTAWQIVGTSNPSLSTGTTTSNVAIYTATDSTPDPVSGVRSDLYLIGNGINPAFFIKPI